MDDHERDLTSTTSSSSDLSRREFFKTAGKAAAAGIVISEASRIPVIMVEQRQLSQAEEAMKANLEVECTIRIRNSHTPDVGNLTVPDQSILVGEITLPPHLEDRPDEESQWIGGMEIGGRKATEKRWESISKPKYVGFTDSPVQLMNIQDLVLHSTDPALLAIRAEIVARYAGSNSLAFLFNKEGSLAPITAPSRRTFLGYMLALAGGTVSGVAAKNLLKNIPQVTDTAQLDPRFQHLVEPLLPLDDWLIETRNLNMLINTYALKPILSKNSIEHVRLFAASGHQDIIFLTKEKPGMLESMLEKRIQRNLLDIVESHINYSSSRQDDKDVQAIAETFLAFYVGTFLPPTLMTNRVNDIPQDGQSNRHLGDQISQCTFLVLCNQLKEIEDDIKNNKIYPDNSTKQQQAMTLLRNSFFLATGLLDGFSRIKRYGRSRQSTDSIVSPPAMSSPQDQVLGLFGRSIYYNKGIITNVSESQ